MRPIVYLDIDGVLNTDEYIDTLPDTIPMTRQWWVEMIDPKRIEILNVLAEHCYFVLSTSWRMHWSDSEMQDILNERGFKGIIVGRTPKKISSTRQEEISMDLKNRNPINYVVLDDLTLNFPEHFVQTNGITEGDVAKAMEIISDQKDS